MTMDVCLSRLVVGCLCGDGGIALPKLTVGIVLTRQQKAGCRCACGHDADSRCTHPGEDRISRRGELRDAPAPPDNPPRPPGSDAFVSTESLDRIAHRSQCNPECDSILESLGSALARVWQHRMGRVPEKGHGPDTPVRKRVPVEKLVEPQILGSGGLNHRAETVIQQHRAGVEHLLWCLPASWPHPRPATTRTNRPHPRLRGPSQPRFQRPDRPRRSSHRDAPPRCMRCHEYRNIRCDAEEVLLDATACE